ncbi:MAG: hypothetical protein ACE5EL_05105, partial [Anaerolineae bacterium]
LIKDRPFDLVITMTRLGGWDARKFAEGVNRIKPDLKVIVLVDEPRELARYSGVERRRPIDRHQARARR